MTLIGVIIFVIVILIRLTREFWCSRQIFKRGKMFQGILHQYFWTNITFTLSKADFFIGFSFSLVCCFSFFLRMLFKYELFIMEPKMYSPQQQQQKKCTSFWCGKMWISSACEFVYHPMHERKIHCLIIQWANSKDQTNVWVSEWENRSLKLRQHLTTISYVNWMECKMQNALRMFVFFNAAAAAEWIHQFYFILCRVFCTSCIALTLF